MILQGSPNKTAQNTCTIVASDSKSESKTPQAGEKKKIETITIQSPHPDFPSRTTGIYSVFMSHLNYCMILR